MTAGGFHQYTGSYAHADTIQPGKGYWVKVDRDGKLILSTSHMLTPEGAIAIVPTSELPPPPPGGESMAAPREMPGDYSLEQNYPNPFNPATEVSYRMPEAGWVTLKVYDLLGQEVASLVDEYQGPGYKSVRWDAQGVPSGVYYYQIIAGSFSDAKRLVVMK
jgi:hypothetical protein